MAVLDGKETYKSLKKKGFQDSERTNKDHKFVDFVHNGKLTHIYTKFSHNGDDIMNPLITKMAKQTYLPRETFIQFAKCTFSKEEYIQHLISIGEI